MPDSPATTRTYDAATAKRSAFHFIFPVFGYPSKIWRSRFLVANFFRRELLGRFRGSFLGILWVLIHPIFLFIVYFLVFGMLFGNWRFGDPPDPNFALWLFSGMIAFQALIEGTTGCCTAVVSNGNLVKKVAFPSEVLPVHVSLVSLIVYLVGVLVFLIAVAVFKMLGVDIPSIKPGWMLLTLPLVLVVQFVMTLGIGLILANLYVFARDVRHLWGILSMAWLFLSPVFWFPHRIAEKFGEFTPTFFAMNPSYPLLMAHRIALGGTDAPIGDASVQFGNFWQHLGIAAAWAFAFLIVGYSSFMSRRHRYADLI